MTTAQRRLNRHHRAGFLAGIGAGTVVTALMLLGAKVLGTFSLPELFGYRVIALLPLNVFSALLETFGTAAKQLLLLGAIVGQVVICGLLGVVWASCTETLPNEERPRRRWPTFWNPTLGGGVFFALLLFIVVEIFGFTLLGAGGFGANLPSGLGLTTLALALQATVYGVTLAALYRLLMAAPAPAPLLRSSLSRRQLLIRSALGLGALLLGGGVLRQLTQAPATAKMPRASGRVGNNGLPPEITPTSAFYQVSKNFADPKVAEPGWTLQIGGLVERPYSLTLAEIRALPAVTETRTLCCISNEVGGDLISNTTWKGVRLSDLLAKAGVKPGAVDLALGAYDGYTESFPIEKALHGDVLAVYEMNGEPLPDNHGYPLRLLVPDIYGMKNVKWLTKINVIATDFQGYWQENGWSDVATIKTMSRIDFPRELSLLPTTPTKVGGIAFAGARGISNVEVSPDGGKSWQSAQLRKPLGPYTWVLWSATITIEAGEQLLMVRATDGSGNRQTDRLAPPLPDGATGWATVRVRVANGVPAPIIVGGDA